MIPAFVQALCGNTSIKSAGTTLDLTTTVASTAGNLIIARVLFDNAATASKPIVSSIGKPAGETATWVLLGAARSTSTSSGAFSSGEMWAIKTTVSWPTATYTVTLDTSVTMKAGHLVEFSGAMATTRSTTATNYSTTTTAASATTTGTAPVANDLALGFIFGSNVAAAQAGDNDTTNGSWSTPIGIGSTGSSGASNNFGIGQYKVVTGTTHQTLNNQAAMTAGNGAIVAVLQSQPDPAITQAAYRIYNDGSEPVSSNIATNSTTNAVGVISMGQSFIGNGRTLSGVEFLIRSAATVGGTVTAALYAHTGTYGDHTTGLPTGSALATSTTTLTASAIGTSDHWEYFAFDGTYTLANGTPYFIVLQFSGMTNNSSFIVSRNVSTSHSGNGSFHNGTLWVIYAYDFCFTVYSPSVSTALAAQDTAPTVDVSDGDVNFQLRARLQTTTSVEVPPADDFKLQWQRNSSGVWTDVVIAAGNVVLDSWWGESSQLQTILGPSGSVSAAGQSFKGNGQKLIGISAQLIRTGTTPGELTAYIYAVSGTHGTDAIPTGSPVATSTSMSASSVTTFANETSFTFDGTYTLVNGTTYCVVIASNQNSASGSNIIQWYYNSTTSSHAGNASQRSSSGTWSTLTGDMMFNVFTTPNTVIPYNSSNLTDNGATTNRLGSGTGSFVAGKIGEQGYILDFGWAGSSYTEVLYSLTLKYADVSNSDALTFRIIRNGSTSTMTYSVTPTINITKIDVAVTQDDYNFYTTGVENIAPSLGTEGSASTIDLYSGDYNVALRIRLQSTNGSDLQSTNDWQLQCEVNGDGAWANIGSGSVIDSYSEVNTDTQTQMYLSASINQAAMSFLGTGTKLKSFKFNASKIGSPPGDVTAYLYAHSGTYGSGVPTGSPLATATPVSAASLSTATNSLVTFTLPTGYTLTASTPYFIAIEYDHASSTSSNCIQFGRDTTSIGHPGNYAAYTTSWSNQFLELPFYALGPMYVDNYNSADLTDGGATTNRLSGGSGGFVAGKISEDGLVDNLGWTGNSYTEVLYSMTLKSSELAHGDTLRFRVLLNGATTYLTYTSVPTINITKTPPAITQAAYRFYADGTESGSTALSVQDTAYGADISAGDVNLQLRMRLQSTNATSIPSTDDWQLQWEKNASGDWNESGILISDSYTETPNSSAGLGISGNGNGAGQTFKGNGYFLTEASFILSKTGAPTGTLTAELYAHTGTYGSGGTGTGSVLAVSTSSISCASVSTTQTWYSFTFDGTYTLANDTSYVIIVRIAPTFADTSNYINLHVVNSGTHAGNHASVNAAGTWSGPTSDSIFVVETSTSVMAFDSSNLTDGGATTNRLTGGSGSFIAGKISEDGLVDDLGFSGNNYTEVLYSLTLKEADLSDGDVLRFRVVSSGTDTTETYSVTPTINISSVTVPEDHIYLGDTLVSAMKLGDVNVTKVYLGDTQVFPAS